MQCRIGNARITGLQKNNAGGNCEQMGGSFSFSFPQMREKCTCRLLFIIFLYCLVASAAAVRNHSQSLEVLMPEFRFYCQETMKPRRTLQSKSPESFFCTLFYTVFPLDVFYTFHT